MHIETSDVLVSPVYSSEFANFAKLDSDDPMINTVLNVATSAVFAFLKQDLLTRTWTLTHSEWPHIGTLTKPSLSRPQAALKRVIELPYTNLVSVDSVLIDGETTTNYSIIKGKPYALEFDAFASACIDGVDSLVVTYKAGFGVLNDDVPQPIRHAIMLAANYIYSHALGCNYSDAITMSGAKQILTPYAVKAGVVI